LALRSALVVDRVDGNHIGGGLCGLLVGNRCRSVGRADRVRGCDVAGACCAGIAAGEEAGALAYSGTSGADDPEVGGRVISA